ncbi:TlpA disulfide reductase family protein [Sulfuriroseicoccus oceanibius]|uniref:TlpA family protein disulfide reductase n=1 Tax=Sulfuriroseicoccus oceanibius TaxID=2707525 RepID=A0A6B3LBX2_9BACT|nr:TlpA disulfide reductase family protein [Sulfuriroseicoccus oceanibius]QQL45157.1 TlpA family protein disulfide reductase [Sulfuriroseicoccus oceanibius]
MKVSSLIKKSSLLMAMAASLSFTASAQEASLKPGAEVPSLELEGVTWVQGEPVKTLDEEGKLYLVECWATWCGPCIAAIPHVNDLSQKFSDDGLVVIGMNVWEDGLEKVQKFVADKGEGMSYRVAYSGGRSSAFADQWLKPAGAKGIPFALLVRDGKLVATAHPSEITDDLVKMALSDDFDAEQFAAKRAEEKAAAEAEDKKIQTLMQQEKWDELKAFANSELADNPSKQRTILGIAAINSGDWAEIQKMVEASEGQERDMMFIRSAFMAPSTDDAKAFATKALETFTESYLIEEGNIARNFAPTIARARFLWLSGDQDAAKASITKLKEQVDANEQAKASGMGSILDKIEAKLTEGEFPPASTLMR